MQRFLSLALLAVGAALSFGAQAVCQQVPTEATRGFAVLVDGRAKPLDSFAREQVTAITGRPSFDGLTALDIVWGYHLDAATFRGREYLRIDSMELKAKLGLDPERKRYSFDALMANTGLHELVEPAMELRRAEAELSMLDRDALDTYAKMTQIADLMSGDALQVVPVVGADGRWSTPKQMREATAPAQQAVYAGFTRLAAAYGKGDGAAFAAAAGELGGQLRAVDPSVYPSEAELSRELLYNDWNFFGKAWVFYLLAFLGVLLFGFGKWRWGYVGGMLLLLAGFLCHSTGFGLRWFIAGRAPVSDMYESLVFMGWGVIAIGLVLEVLYRKRYFALAASLMGFLTLMFAERLPLDSSINPLVPVLAHTWWLSIHVMTIMLSYSAFALTMALGHIVIGIQLFRPGKTDTLRSLSSLLYKALQVGLLFLCAGIVFGAIWANESWGRYWGWDPKETWSLITFFVYLAIVHARFAGWLHNFGLAVWAIAGFLSVLMTYYGVNFILGSGLHSYGEASGGMLWVGLYLAIEIAVIVVATLRYRMAVRRGLIVDSALA